MSFPDAAYTWLVQNVGKVPVMATIFIVLTISVVLLARRIALWIKFEAERRYDRQHYGKLLETTKVGKRTVDAYLSPTYRGSPFTGGILRPYICFPEGTFEKLSDAERRSAFSTVEVAIPLLPYW